MKNFEGPGADKRAARGKVGNSYPWVVNAGGFRNDLADRVH